MQINELRNRIAHHEPICFYGNLVSTANVEAKYNILLELLKWLGCKPDRILYGIDGVHKSLKGIKHIEVLIRSPRK